MLFSLFPASLAEFVTSHWILVIASLLPALYWYSNRNFDYWTKRGIKGPPPTPLFGNFFSLFTPMPVLHSQYLQKYGKTFGLFQGQTPQLVCAEPEIIKRLMVKDFHLFRNRSTQPVSHRIFGQNLARVEGDQWKRIRSILSPMFTSLKLRNMENVMQSCAKSLLDSFETMSKNKTVFEARTPMGNYTMDVIAKCAFAAETNAHQETDSVFLKNAKSIFLFSWLRFLGTVFVPRWVQQLMIDYKLKPFYQNEWDFFEQISRHLIKERRDQKDGGKKFNDILQLLVNAEHSVDALSKTFKDDLSKEADGHHVHAGNEELEREERELKDIIGSKYLSEEEIMAQAMVFFLAGYETTAATLSYTLYELAMNPDVQEKLYQEIQETKRQDPSFSNHTLTKLPFLDAVITEALRKWPPAMMTARQSFEDDYYIPELKLYLKKDQVVMFPVYAMHHSEEFFPNPEKYDPDRWMPENRDKIIPYTYLPFGGGPRNCIGMRFALTEAKIGLALMMDKFKIVKVKETTELKILPCAGLIKTSPIYLGVEKRK